jgi:hypothetical protein
MLPPSPLIEHKRLYLFHLVEGEHRSEIQTDVVQRVAEPPVQPQIRREAIREELEEMRERTKAGARQVQAGHGKGKHGRGEDICTKQHPEKK